MPNLRNFAAKCGSRLALAAVSLTVGASAFAQSAGPVADAVTQLGTLSGSTEGFGTVMFGLAIVATGIMIGVKWIKRGKSAA